MLSVILSQDELAASHLTIECNNKNNNNNNINSMVSGRARLRSKNANLTHITKRLLFGTRRRCRQTYKYINIILIFITIMGSHSSGQRACALH